MSERKEDEAHRGPKARSRRIIFWASRRRKREMIRDFPVERVTRIELAWPAWKYSARRVRHRQTPAGLTLSDHRKPPIAATCGPTVARRAPQVRFLINRFPTLQTGVHRRPPKPIRERTNSNPNLVFVEALEMRVAKGTVRRLGYRCRRVASPLLRPDHRHSLTRGCRQL
jgi:hypothetical protein